MWYGASGLKYGAPGAFDLGFEVFGSCIVEEDGYIWIYILYDGEEQDDAAAAGDSKARETGCISHHQLSIPHTQHP